MSGKDLSREEREGLTMWGDAISAQVRDRGQVALHVRKDAPRSSEKFHPVLLEARDVARLRALLNEAERRGAVSEAMPERELEKLLDYADSEECCDAYNEYLVALVRKVVPEVRRSHAEAAELRERVEVKDSTANAAESRYEQQYVRMYEVEQENAELREKVRELEGEEVIEHPIVLKASLACAENQRDYYYQMWQQQTAELRKKVAAYEDVLGHYGHLDEACAALSKQGEEEGRD